MLAASQCAEWITFDHRSALENNVCTLATSTAIFGFAVYINITQEVDTSFPKSIRGNAYVIPKSKKDDSKVLQIILKFSQKSLRKRYLHEKSSN